eukprot:TRINITY_DN49636_c0_g1_i1.p1 TRINITY_DN49636_c0_g1~~TRINITY_DN49636_c0_g1_i1.p1  ORF type:complete len:426 (-),score=55.07 TRINITY_DN49636_c0_g1_i1:1353-2630(-)
MRVFVLFLLLGAAVAFNDDEIEFIKALYALPTRKHAEEAAHVLHHEHHWRLKHNITWPVEEPKLKAFECSWKPSEHTPKTIHELRPRDIQVIGALGDSLTAAFGARSWNLLNIANWKEYRGISWSGGGRDSVQEQSSLPNIIKYFQPTGYMKGYATAETPVKEGPLDVEHAHLNQARTAARSDAMPARVDGGKDWIGQPGEVANFTRVGREMLGASGFANAWKLVTIFIGANDLCWACDCEGCNATREAAANYRDQLTTALDYLHKNSPKTFVAIVLPVDPTRLFPIKSGLCSSLHGALCGCGTSDDEAWRASVTKHTNEYDAVLEDIVKKYDNDDQFAAVVQPFFVNTYPPKKPDGSYDKSYFAPDCFHFSAKAHAQAGLALWNNLVQPVGQKRKDWHYGEKITCPPDDQYLCTKKNAGKGHGC